MWVSFSELGWPGSAPAENDQYARAALHSSDHSLASLTSGAPVGWAQSVGPHPGGKMLKHKIRKSRKNILSLLEAVTQEEAEKGEAKETGRGGKKEKTGQ